MRKSRAITLSFLGLGTVGLAGGCGTEPPPAPATAPTVDSAPSPAADPREIVAEPDGTWFDEQGNPIREEWTIDPEGNPVPVTHPHDQFGRPWVTDSEGHLAPPPRTVVRTTPLFGALVFVHGVRGGRPGGTVANRNTIPRAGLGTTGGRVGGSSAT